MNLVKKVLFSLALLLTISFTSTAQSGWRSGTYYAYQGQTWVDYSYRTVGFDQWNRPIVRKMCRQNSWYQQQRSGYIYLWGNNGWYKEWRSGNFWYYKWSGWYYCS